MEPVQTSAAKWKRVLLVLLLGPLPAGCVVGISSFAAGSSADPLEYAPVAAAALGSLWGLTVGILRKSLLKAMIGLNVGAFIGFTWTRFADKYGHHSDALVVVSLIFAGAIFGAALTLDLKKIFSSLLGGAAAGAIAFAAMGISAWVVTLILRPDIFGWTVMCLIPFGSGVALFVWLIGRPEKTGR